MIVNVGSINIDHVYRVARLPVPGETCAATDYARFLGGKGVNQSIAITRAGGRVRHVGAVGPDGDWALTEISRFGVDPRDIERVAAPTGHAIIHVDDCGENVIVILGGANQAIDLDRLEAILDDARSTSDRPVWVLLQNETNGPVEIVRLAKAAGCRVAYCAAPFLPERVRELMGDIDLLALNAGEAAALAESLAMDIASVPVPEILVTCGRDGAMLRSGDRVIRQDAFAVDPVDTTGAGDTFLGSFLAGYSRGVPAHEALRYAAAASAVQVTRPGAAAAIPVRADVEAFLAGQGA